MTPLSVLSGCRSSPSGARYFTLVFLTFALTVGVSSIANAAEVLVGSSTIPNFKAETDTAGETIANGYKAAHSGNVVTLEDYIAKEGTESATSVELGIYSGASKPETLLGHCLVSSAPKKSEWIKCTGLSVAVTIGTKYWLVELALGGNTHYEAINGGEPAYGAKTFTKLEPSAISWTERSAKGPAPFLALGEEKEIPTTTELATKSLEKIEAITAEVKALKSFVEGGIKVTCTSGCTGGGGGEEISGSVNVSAFNSTAKAELSELKEDMETVGWCVIGTLIAITVTGFVVILLRTRT